jgi:hypothetical protein
MHTRPLLLIVLAGLAFVGCKKSESEHEDHKPAPGAAAAKGELPKAQFRAARFRNAGTITGVVSLPAAHAAAAKAGAVLFVIVRKDAGEGQRGALVAAKRVPVTGAAMFPHTFTVSGADVMMAGTAFAGKMRVEARLDADGDALSKKPGDVSAAAKPAEVGAKGLALTLDQVL